MAANAMPGNTPIRTLCELASRPLSRGAVAAARLRTCSPQIVTERTIGPPGPYRNSAIASWLVRTVTIAMAESLLWSASLGRGRHDPTGSLGRRRETLCVRVVLRVRALAHVAAPTWRYPARTWTFRHVGA